MSGGPIVAAVLAAGAGRRFGDAPKQLADLGGRPLIEHAIAAAAAAPGIGRTLVVLGCGAGAVRGGADLSPAEPVLAADWAGGQSASMRAAVGAAGPDAAALVVLLGDQPLIAPEAIAAVIAAATASGDGEAANLDPARAFYAGRPGHPALIPRRLFGAVAELRGDEGARGLLAEAGVRRVDCDGLGSALDVDTVADLERARRYAASAS